MSYFEKVYEIVKKIPAGKVATYGQIARLWERLKGQNCGWALHKNPYYGEVPCHRVVNRNGEISSGFAFGARSSRKKCLRRKA